MRYAAFILVLLGASMIAYACSGSLFQEEAASQDSEFVGFRGACKFTFSAHKDPIRPASHHLHDFWGITALENDASYENLRATVSNCDRQDEHSAVWAPVLRESNARDTLIVSNRAGMYFQTLGGLNPKATQPFPLGVKMLATEENGSVKWHCDTNQTGQEILEEPPASCPEGTNGIGLKITFPECWDGKLSLVADGSLAGAHNVVPAVKKPDGSKACPGANPVQLPTLTLWPDYPGFTLDSPLEVSSGQEAWSGPETMHADIFVGVDTGTLVEECIHDPALDGEPRPAFCDATKNPEF